MPALKQFPKDTNGSPFEIGLVLLPASKQPSVIEGTEYGLEQGTLQFATYNHNYRRLRPLRGLPVTELRPGDDPTRAFLRAFNFLGVQSCRFTPNGYGPGKGILEVLTMGAIFPDPVSPDPRTAPLVTDTGTKDTIQTVIYDMSVIPIKPLYNVTIEYFAPQIRYEYMARFRATVPRFVGSDFNLDASGFIDIGDTEKLGLQVSRVTALVADVTIAPVGTPAILGMASWLPFVQVAVSGADDFQQTPAGYIFHVVESGTIKLGPTIPAVG